MSQEVPERLYHYTSLKGLRGIIENQHLRMTNLFWMDDTTEVLWVYEVVKRLLDEEPRQTDGALAELTERFGDGSLVGDVYSSSFSTEPDSRSQWLEYADDGHGFAIGFDPATFDLKRPEPERDVVLQPVVYDKEEQEETAREYIRLSQQRGNPLFEEAARGAALYNIWERAARFKNPVFRSEKEWRLIFRDKPGERLKFHEKAGRHLIPFLDFPIHPEKNPIREVRLGPRNQSQRDVDAIRWLLGVCGYDVEQVEFRRSSIPLRAEY